LAVKQPFPRVVSADKVREERTPNLRRRRRGRLIHGPLGQVLPSPRRARRTRLCWARSLELLPHLEPLLESGRSRSSSAERRASAPVFQLFVSHSLMRSRKSDGRGSKRVAFPA